MGLHKRLFPLFGLCLQCVCDRCLVECYVGDECVNIGFISLWALSDRLTGFLSIPSDRLSPITACLDYERDRVGKYARYFQANVIKPIPEISKVLKPWTLSLVVTDLKTRKLIGLKKDTFEELHLLADIPCQYFCRRNFPTWDVFLPTGEQAAKIAGSNIMTKFFILQSEYMGTRRVQVTVCNVQAFLTGEILASFLSTYGCVEDVLKLRSATGTAHDGYVFQICLTREGFQLIPDTIVSRQVQMMVMVECR